MEAAESAAASAKACLDEILQNGDKLAHELRTEENLAKRNADVHAMIRDDSTIFALHLLCSCGSPSQMLCVKISSYVSARPDGKGKGRLL